MKKTKNTILITGCSSGIGFATAIKLSDNGWDVYATCRNQKDVEKLKKIGLKCLKLDYTNEESIDNTVNTILKETDGKLSAIFNNGAYALPGALEDIPTEGLRSIFETNVFGWHSLIKKVLPVMKKQGHGKILQCSSILGFITLAYRGPYNATKWAIEALTDTLRIELSGTDIKVITIRPGPISTKIRSNSLEHFKKWVNWKNSSIKGLYKNHLIPRLYSKSAQTKFELQSEAVADMVLKALQEKNPKLIYSITIHTHIMNILIRILPKGLLNKLLIYLSEPV